MRRTILPTRHNLAKMWCVNKLGTNLQGPATGCRGRDSVHQARIRVHADMRLHAEVPLIAFSGLVHLRVALAIAVLGGTGRRNQCSVDGRALPERQTLVGQGSVDRGRDLLGQVVLFEQMAKPKDTDAVGQSISAIQSGKRPVERDIEQSFLHSKVAQAKPLLQEMQPQHGLVKKRRTTSRLGQRHQLIPRHDQLDLIKELRLARAPRAQVQIQVLLLHADIVSRLRLCLSPRKAEF